jgi:hypothetical protein
MNGPAPVLSATLELIGMRAELVTSLKRQATELLAERVLHKKNSR